MAEAMDTAGGFLSPPVTSPSLSSISVSSSTSQLPHPRSKPIRAGSAKEDTTRQWVENKLLYISRRYTRKFQPSNLGEKVPGYTSMSQVCKDFGEVVNVLWFSGTPSLQVPYLLTIALSVNSYLSAFPPAPVSTFALLGKLDHVFSSLLKGEDTVSGEVLPGFENGKRAMSTTDMVRCKSLVEAARIQIVDTMSKGEEEEEEKEESASVDESGADTDPMTNAPSLDEDEGDDRHHMAIAKVYEATIMQLGEHLGALEAFNTGDPNS